MCSFKEMRCTHLHFQVVFVQVNNNSNQQGRQKVMVLIMVISPLC